MATLAAADHPIVLHGTSRHDRELDPFDRAALEKRGAEGVVPVSRGGELELVLCLGPKRSGDVYTSTDVALLSSVAQAGAQGLERTGATTAGARAASLVATPATPRAESRSGHRLAAIVNADVVGYSERMARDEARTIAAVRAARTRAAELATAHRGRLVDFTGDDFLAEFPSALDAVGFALAFQSAEQSTLPFRMGVHLGDVREEEGALYGSGVNVAARLQGLAAPGGVCVSAAVREQTLGKLDVGFEDLGERTLKNLPEPVRAWRIR